MENKFEIELVGNEKDIIIRSDNEYASAGEFLSKIKGAMKRIEDELEPGIKQAFGTHKLLVAQKKKYLEPFENAEKSIKAKMSAYYLQQEALRIKEQKRLEAELKAKHDQEALENAIQLEKAGLKKEADIQLDFAAERKPVVVVENTTVSKSSNVKKIFKFRIVNEQEIKRSFLIPDEKAIGNLVEALGMKASEQVGGIEVYEEAVIYSKTFY